MLPRVFLLMLTIVFSVILPVAGAGEKKPTDDVAEMKVRLKLNAIEGAILLDYYGVFVKRELDLRDSVRASIKSGVERLPEYQKALEEVRADLEVTKKRLITIESEKAKLIEKLGPKNVAEESTENAARISRILEQLLDRLTIVEKRLQKLERDR